MARESQEAPTPNVADMIAAGETHICGCDCGHHSENEAAEAARFPDACRKRILLFMDRRRWPGDARMGMTFEQFLAIYRRAANRWGQVAGLRFVVSIDLADLDPAHCYVTFHNFQNDVLADSHLANGTCGDHFRQRYDWRIWSEHLLYLTVLHELGHLLGLVHKNGNFVMNPRILTNLPDLTKNDISRAVSLYGPPLTDPEEPEPNDPPAPPQPPEDKPVNWLDFIVKVLPILLECLNKDQAKALKRIRAGKIGLRATLQLWADAKAAGHTGRREIRAYVEDARLELAAEATALSDDELVAAIHQARDLATATGELQEVAA